ncbi:MAG: primosomal protein N' [Alphaproteobacteria bacterium]|nr:primosomal protein N' [Alphaproteobacteria bacterium]
MKSDSSTYTPYNCGSLVEVLTAQAAPKPFTYAVPDGAEVMRGQLVSVPLGPKKSYGVVLGASRESIPANKLKTIHSIVDAPPLSDAMLDFILWVADYCMAPTGNILAMALGGETAQKTPKKERAAKKETEHPSAQKPILSPEQHKAADTLIKSLGSFSVTLLDGVTGSGKTETFCEAICAAMAKGQQSLLMLPEISLTTQIFSRLAARFGQAPVLWHSGLTPAQRRKAWQAIAHGKAPLVIGARSALFLPFQNLGLIVVDEEHDGSYKQEEGVIYNARDMAVMRGKLQNIPVILSSATPSLETIVNMKAGRYGHVTLPQRHGEAKPPSIHLIDLRQEKLTAKNWISPSLQTAIHAAIGRGEQALLFLNRRGYAPLTLCRACGYRFQCPSCSSWLVEHRQDGKHRLICHHCDYACTYPRACPSCSAEDRLAACGPGIERLAEEAKKLFPNARHAILASDTQNNLSEVQCIVDAMAKSEIDILIGTQIVAKGYHFPKLTVVGVIDADLGLQGGDLRAAERTFQLLYQVAGRSGRSDDKGHVYLQTTQPQHAVMQNLTKHNRDGLIDVLISERQKFHMPPFARLATLTLSGTNHAVVTNVANDLAKHIPIQNGFKVLGPAPAPMALLRGRHRQRFLIQSPKSSKMQDFLRDWLSAAKPSKSIRVHIDIDPQSFV